MLSRFFLFFLPGCVCLAQGALNLEQAFFGGAVGQSAAQTTSAPTGVSKERVIVLANNNDPDSTKLARAYCEKRGIPFANIFSLPMPTDETITREQFNQSIYNPLLSELIASSWISAAPTQNKDAFGRLTPSVTGHKIDFLVLMRGVPLRIARDTMLLELETNKPQQAEFQINEASVDSELSCMLMGSYPLIAFVPNPLFNKRVAEAADLQKVIRVSRLDGARTDHVISLIDSALEGERAGLRGRAYLDMGGPHEKGDEWISQTMRIFESWGFDLTVEKSKQLLGFDNRWDATALYLGWYADHVRGPMSYRDFKFAPGAIAWHIHSFSAFTLHDPAKGWLAAFAQRGAAASLGNVYEPYLELSHMPPVYFTSLRDGKTHGEAAYASMPVLSWMSIVLGDPLYRPLATPLAEQIERIRKQGERSPYAQYVVIRVMKLLEGAQKKDEALLLGRQCLRVTDGLALAYEVGTRLWDSNRKQAEECFERFKKAPSLEGDNMSVGIIAAKFLAEKNRDPAAAVQIYTNIMNAPNTPREAQKVILPTAIIAARATGKPDLAARWQTRLNEITQPSAK